MKVSESIAPSHKINCQSAQLSEVSGDNTIGRSNMIKHEMYLLLVVLFFNG